MSNEALNVNAADTVKALREYAERLEKGDKISVVLCVESLSNENMVDRIVVYGCSKETVIRLIAGCLRGCKVQQTRKPQSSLKTIIKKIFKKG